MQEAPIPLLWSLLRLNILILVIPIGLACAEPYADWSDDEGLTQPNKDRLLVARRSRVPDKREVPFPKFPESRLLVGDTSPFTTAPVEGRLPLMGILLVSESDVPDIAEWYRHQLPTYSELAFSTKEGRRMILYINGCRDFKSEQDCIDSAPGRAHVLITELTSTLQALAVKYKTLIEIVYDPPK
jgi:hypothetical protein